jgi:5'-nucleotidase/UDP-sugar diphosphatase
MRTRWAIGLAILAFVGCSAQPREVVIFHTNDIHGDFAAEPASWRKDNASAGGMAALYDHLDSLRRLYPHSLYLDAGDLMTGNPVCDLEYDGVRGGALLEMLNRCSVSAEALGNHEFDQGAEHLRDWVAAAPYPILCANLREKALNRPLCSEYRTFEVNGVHIGVIGLITDGLSSLVARSALEPFEVEDATTTAQKLIDEIDPSTDLIVLLTHLGVEQDSVMATRIHGADVIVGSHSHTRLEKPLSVNGVVIVQAGAQCKNLGVLRVSVADDRVTRFDGRLEELVARPGRPSSPVSMLADSLEIVIQSKYGHVIGDLEQVWIPSYYSTSNVGNWICDRLRERYRADVALVNAGGIRTRIDPGPITELDILELLPFSDAVVTFEASGSELLVMAENQARAATFHDHGVLELSGMTIAYRKSSGRIEEIDAQIAGQPIEPGRTYRIVSVDYVAQSQWDKHLGFKPANLEVSGDLLSDVVIAEVKKVEGPIRSDVQPRLKEMP